MLLWPMDREEVNKDVGSSIRNVQDLNEDVGSSIRNVQCAILRDTLYIYCTLESIYTNGVVFVSTDLKQWSFRYVPRSFGAFIAHKDLLLMIGGDSGQGKYPDKAVLCSCNGFDWEVSSLPILPEEILSQNLRVNVRAVSNDDLVCVSVTYNGHWLRTPYDELCLCVLLENQWFTVESPILLPNDKIFIPVIHLTIAGGELFMHTEQWVYHCALMSLIASCGQPHNPRQDIIRYRDIRPQDCLWNVFDYSDHLISFGQHLIVFDKSVMVCALSPLTKSWVHITNTPDHIRRIQCAAIHPSGDLLLVHGDSNIEFVKLCVTRVKMRGEL